jgi:hypothetical protein
MFLEGSFFGPILRYFDRIFKVLSLSRLSGRHVSLVRVNVESILTLTQSNVKSYLIHERTTSTPFCALMSLKIQERAAI